MTWWNRSGQKLLGPSLPHFEIFRIFARLKNEERKKEKSSRYDRAEEIVLNIGFRNVFHFPVSLFNFPFTFQMGFRSFSYFCGLTLFFPSNPSNTLKTFCVVYLGTHIAQQIKNNASWYSDRVWKVSNSFYFSIPTRFQSLELQKMITTSHPRRPLIRVLIWEPCKGYINRRTNIHP